MKTIKLARVDSKLSHGKMALLWSEYLNLDHVIVVNDEVSNDSFLKHLMDLTIPYGISMHYTSTDDFNEFFKKTDASNIFIIVKNIDDLNKLIQNGAPIEDINLGLLEQTGMKKELNMQIAIGKKDIKILKEWIDAGRNVNIQYLPNSIKRDLKDFVKSA